jgi:hypothetical protein
MQVNVTRIECSKEVSNQQRWISTGILVFISVSSAYLFLYNPDGTNAYPSCPLFAVTGLYCPGCGSLRASHQLLHGNISAAFNLNPLMVLSLPLIIWFGVSQLSIAIKRCSLPSFFLSSFWIWIILAIIIIYWVLRNIPVYPLELLAP